MIARDVVIDCEVSTDVEPEAAVLYDRSRYKNNGTISGATWVQIPSGLWVLQLNGSSNRCYFTDTWGGFSGIPCAIETWVNISRTAGQKGSSIYWFGGAIYQHTNGNLYWPGTSDFLSISEIHSTLNTWHHLIITWVAQSDTAKGYIDGAERSITVQGGADNLSFGFSLGHSSNSFEGMMGLHRTYRYTMSAGEALQRYEATKRLFEIN